MAARRRTPSSRQPAGRGRLSLVGRPSPWRAKHIKFGLGRRNFDISLRRFRTQPANRTKRHPQLVLGLYQSPVREVALTVYYRPRSGRQASASRVQLAKLTPLGLSAAGLVFFSVNLYSTPNLQLARSPSQVKAATVALPPAKHYPRSVPVELIIPKIGVDTPLQTVELNHDGSLAVPADYHLAGWYSGSPTPGEIGPSIIDGHVDNVAGIGVFWRLRELAAGDHFQVKRADKSAINFVIDKVELAPQNQFPTAEVYGKINYAGVRLISCGGTFNTSTGHYSDNIIVFASAQ